MHCSTRVKPSQEQFSQVLVENNQFTIVMCKSPNYVLNEVNNQCLLVDEQRAEGLVGLDWI